MERENHELVREGRIIFQPPKDTWWVWNCVINTWFFLQARELVANQVVTGNVCCFHPLCLAVSMDSAVKQAWVLAELIWVLVESRRVHSGYKRLSLLHLFVTVGDLRDFCLQFSIFFTKQPGHELFICFSSLTHRDFVHQVCSWCTMMSVSRKNKVNLASVLDLSHNCWLLSSHILPCICSSWFALDCRPKWGFFVGNDYCNSYTGMAKTVHWYVGL